MPDKRREGIVLGFDFGTRFIGVAVGQTLTRTVRPLPHLKARDGIPDWQIVEKLLKEWSPLFAIVGLPLNMDGSESDMSRRARKFANRLHGRFGLKVNCQDERLSSFEAKGILTEAGTQARQGGELDSIAATLILESWLRHQGPD